MRSWTHQLYTKYTTGGTKNTERVAFWAEWNLDMAPLDELKAVIKTLNGKWWWRAPDDTQLARARTAWTESTREWGEEIKYLHQIVVESLNEGGLRKCAVSGGMLQEDANCLRGIQLVTTVLMQKGKTEEEAPVCTRLLVDLTRMRNVVDAHRSTKKRAELIKEMRTQHGNLHSAYTATVNGCTRALEQIARIL